MEKWIRGMDLALWMNGRKGCVRLWLVSLFLAFVTDGVFVMPSTSLVTAFRRARIVRAKCPAHLRTRRERYRRGSSPPFFCRGHAVCILQLIGREGMVILPYRDEVLQRCAVGDSYPCDRSEIRVVFWHD